MNYTNPSRNINSTEFEINKQIISQFIIDRLLPWMNKPYSLDELMLMTASVCRFKPQLILEWGTNAGISARIFYEIITAFKLNSELHTIDLPDDVIHSEHDPKTVGIVIKDIPEINLHRGDGLTCALEIINRKNVEGNILFFVDGDHKYETVKLELQTIISTTPNAIILLHDTLFQSADSGYYTGPFQAIKDVLLERPEHKWIEMNIGGPGMSLVFNSNSLQNHIGF